MELSCSAAQARFHPFSRILPGRAPGQNRPPAESASATCYARPAFWHGTALLIRAETGASRPGCASAESATRGRAHPATNQRDGGPDPPPRLPCRKDRHSGTGRHHSARGLRPFRIDLAIQRRPAATSGIASSREGRTQANRSGRRRHETLEQRRCAAGRGAQLFIHRRQDYSNPVCLSGGRRRITASS